MIDSMTVPMSIKNDQIARLINNFFCFPNLISLQITRSGRQKLASLLTIKFCINLIITIWVMFPLSLKRLLLIANVFNYELV